MPAFAHVDHGADYTAGSAIVASYDVSAVQRVRIRSVAAHKTKFGRPQRIRGANGRLQSGENGVPLILVYDSKRKWQQLSFDALRIFVLQDQLLELRAV